MNMKSILTCLAVLTLSFNAFAVQVQEEPETAALNNVEMNQIKSPDTRLATQIVNSHSISEASAEKPDEFMTTLFVYLVIILVYTIYGIKAHSEKSETE